MTGLKITLERKKNKGNKRKGNYKKSKSNNNNTLIEKLKIALVLGDSMLKKLDGCILSKKAGHKYLVNVQVFLGAKVSCMVDHVISYNILKKIIFQVRKNPVKLRIFYRIRNALRI